MPLTGRLFLKGLLNMSNIPGLFGINQDQQQQQNMNQNVPVDLSAQLQNMNNHQTSMFYGTVQQQQWHKGFRESEFGVATLMTQEQLDKMLKPKQLKQFTTRIHNFMYTSVFMELSSDIKESIKINIGTVNAVSLLREKLIEKV